MSDAHDLGPAPQRIPVDADLVSRLVAEQFPRWAGLPVEPVANGGWDNWTFHLGSTLSVRMPSAAEYGLAVDKEHRWLPVLAPRLPLPIPAPLAKGRPGAGYPFAWSIYPWLDGETARPDRIGDPVRFAVDLAGFLTALQGIDPAGGPRPGKHNWFRGGSLRTFDPMARRALTTLDGHVDVDRAATLWQSTLDAPWDGAATWFHGDIARGNLLLGGSKVGGADDGGGRLAAVIDFGTCGVGDPACDLYGDVARGRRIDKFPTVDGRSGMVPCYTRSMTSASGAVDRRTLLRLAGLSTGATIVATAALPGVAGAATAVFAHGVASGDPLPGGILLWTRVTPTPESLPGSGVGPVVTVDWQVAADPGFADVRRSGAVVTGPDRDHTVTVDVAGLTPATTYWYRFAVAGTWSPVGRTMTAPAADDAVTRLRMGVVSCANWEAGFFSAYRHLAARGDLNVVVHLGDYLYEYGTGEFDAAGTVVRRVAPEHETLSLADYRIRHALYKTDPDLQALHASVPWVITWDDHEVANDMWSGGAENHTPATEGDFGARVRAARQAYAEWMPVRLGADGAIHRRLRYGRLLELSMLDLRTYRSQQTSVTDVDDPDRTIAGPDQLAWLTDGLTGSTATWKLVGNPVMISRLDVATLPAWLLGPLAELLGVPANGYALNGDQWDGYNADRETLVDALRAHATRNVVFLTGDIHTSWANELTTRDTGLHNPAAAEFVVPSVTSDNINDFLGTPPGGPLSRLAADLVRATNQHVKWAELDGHGYGVLDVTTARCRMDWYHLVDRTRKDSATRWAAGFSVAAGSSKLTKESGPA